jgi:hypothetical protein
MAYAAGAASLIGIGLSAYQGQAGLTEQKRAGRFQDESQKRAQDAINKADRKKPDIAAILAAARTGSTGFNPTMLTGSGGLGQLGGGL